MNNESGLDAVLSVFIRYSELSAVKYDVKRDMVKIEIALNDCLPEEQVKQFEIRYRKTMELYYRMLKYEPTLVELRSIEKSGITILRIYRDGQTLREEEMELFVRLLRQEFDSWLVRDDNDLVTGDLLSGEVKKSLLQKIREYRQPYHNIFAYRDDGRVFVFNK
jgi:hypothetical protein